MPNIKSAKKRLRQNEKKRLQNRQKKSSIRTAEKAIRKNVESKNWEEAESHYRIFSKLIDRAAKINIFHKNTASRKKSRLALLINKRKSAT